MYIDAVRPGYFPHCAYVYDAVNVPVLKMIVHSIRNQLVLRIGDLKITWRANACRGAQRDPKIGATGNVRGMSVARPCVRGTHRLMSVLSVARTGQCPCTSVRCTCTSMREGIIVHP